MTLDEINKLNSESIRLLHDSAKFESAQKLLAGLRTGESPLTNEIVSRMEYWKSATEKIARDELFAVINGMAADILRIAEMRLAAAAREAKTSAASKRSIVDAYF